MQGKSFSDLVFSTIGSISVLSIFVVVPYMIGYFSYFDLSLLNVFALSEYYYFSAVPILLVTAVFISYAAMPYLFEVLHRAAVGSPIYLQKMMLRIGLPSIATANSRPRRG